MTLVSLWQDRHPRTPSPGSTAVGGRYDVAVVGAGLTGLTTALLLGRAGRSVIVLEADHVGVGTTGRSTAKLSLLQGTQLSTIASKHSSTVVDHYVAAQREGQAWVERFCAEHDVDLQHRPAYTYAHGAAGVRRARSEFETARRAGLEVEWVDELDLPFETSGGVRLADQVQLDPIELLDALSLQAAAHGVDIVEGARVQQARGTDPVQLTTSAGEVSADRVVLATNMPILDRGGFFARMKPARSYGLAFRTPTQVVDGMYLSADSPSRSLRDAPDVDGSLLLVGGEGHTTGRGGSTERRLHELRSWTAQHWPEAVETHAWSAQDYVTHHSLPYAGPLLPGTPEILLAGGYSKWGMTNAVAASLALSAQVLDGHMEWAEVMRTWSSHDARGLTTAALDNVEVGIEMTSGWVRPLLHPGLGVTPSEGDGAVRQEGITRLPTAVSQVDGIERRVSGVCSHLGGIVRWNDAERSWDCPLHGSRFGPDGALIEGPATCGLGSR